MGVSGYVHCNCLRDGRARPPAELSDIVVDRDGCWDVSDGDWRRRLVLNEWLQRACPHREMEFITERVANHGFLGRFSSEMEELGRQHFPVLEHVLSQLNAAPVPAELGQAALAEVDYFIQRAFIEDDALLYEAGTDVVIWDEAYGRAVEQAADLGMGVDLGGFFVRRACEDGDVELFRATRFTQEVVDPGDDTTPPSVRFADGTHEVTLPIGPIGYPGVGPERVPANLETRTRPPTLHDYRFSVYALRRLFAAAVETGNPINWC
ncbi:hypothetical protein [Actinophytocola oryzae]|nr:hypothetical protein [Actinophytocola oryzae]